MPKSLPRKLRKFSVRASESGFTMIELLVVVIIIAILAAVAVPVYLGIQNNAKKSAIQSDVATTKINVAAALTEDGTVASGTYTSAVKAGDAQVQNSGIGGDEFIKIVVNPDKSFTVEGGSDNLSTYSFYDSSDSSTKNGNQPSVPKGTIAQDMEDPNGNNKIWYAGWTTDQAHSGTHSVSGSWNGGGGFVAGAYANTAVVGKTYNVTAWVYIAPTNSNTSWQVTVSANQTLDTNGGYNTATGYLDPSNPLIQQYPATYTAAAPGKWFKFSKTVVAQSTNPYVQVSAYDGSYTTGAGKTYLDDVTWTPVN